MQKITELVERHRIILACCIRPIFIVGASRAGTTWLQSLLALHPSLFSLPETKFFQNILTPNRNLTFSELYPRKGKSAPKYITPEQLKISLWHLDRIGFIKLPDKVRDFLKFMAEKDTLDICTMLNIIMYNANNNCLENSRKLWIEKTPRHIFFLEDIFRHFPTARVICVFRDLVDQAYSGYKTFNYPVLEGLLDGFNSYEAFEEYVKDTPEKKGQCLKIFYEELKNNPKRTLDEIFNFLDIPPLNLDNNQLNKLSKEKFLEIYKDTEMTLWQPQMAKNKDKLSSKKEEQLFKKHIYLLALISRGKLKNYVNPRPYSQKDSFSIGFIFFLIKHYLNALLFLVKIRLKDLMAKVSRFLNKYV